VLALSFIVRMKKNQKLTHVIACVRLGRYRYTIHAAQRRIKRGITREEIEQILTKGEIIEEYPSHHYGEACLLFGRTVGGRVLHILVSLNETVDIITVYEPDLTKWEEDLKTRRREAEKL
jgi:hypothetical protein